MDWKDILAVTNRTLCAGDFLPQLDRVARGQPKAVILREKDLPAEAYRDLAGEAQEICRQYAVPLYLHSFSQVADAVSADGLHMPLPKLRQLAADRRQDWKVLGTSCHSVEDVQEAVASGCTYIVAGHIYETDCKQGLPGRGLAFLQAACQAAGDVPVYAIGGITPERLPEVLAAGAAGACVMSGMMKVSSWWR
ncbi:thiamine-phosphate pyrophosphorylase [Selenomonas ruminantium]|uniref:Thiamine-phosphate pyrophosphorylase n=1 Tax=Selenomonas ruminantium TaxID=971 RepID=A0A1M6QZ40_SELRU|nr:thiamine phosphate synthase [Selenomonas ruminantium]SHK25495.1 thiamine-phosphate pyrophosphorylase [Selenomonas ruminantium]